MNTLIIILAILWYIIGIISFIYWWTKEFDLPLSMLLFSFITGIIGPLNWIIGWLNVGKNPRWLRNIFKDRCIINKRSED